MLPPAAGGPGVWVGCVVWFNYTARPPPPVVLPGAAFALLCLAGAFAPGFALRTRAAACRFGKVGGLVSVRRGAEKGAIWGGVDVASDNRQDSNQPRLAASSEARLAWSRPPVHPTTSASRAVSWNPVTGFFRAPLAAAPAPVLPADQPQLLPGRPRHCSNSVRQFAPFRQLRHRALQVFAWHWNRHSAGSPQRSKLP